MFPLLLYCDPFCFLRIGIVEGVRMVLDRDHGHLFDRRTELMHVPLDHHGVVHAVESADREVEICVGGEGNELISLPGIDPRHGFETEGCAAIHASGGHRFPGGLKTQAAGGASPFDPLGRLWTEPQIILHHAGRFQLSGEVVGKIRPDGSVDHLFGETRHIPQGIVVRLFHHDTEVLVLMRLGEFRNPAADHVDRSHDRSPFTNSTISFMEAPGLNNPLTPAALRSRRSSSGMIPPPNRTMLPASCSLSNSSTRRNSVLCAPERMLKPIASTSS